VKTWSWRGNNSTDVPADCGGNPVINVDKDCFYTERDLSKPAREAAKAAASKEETCRMCGIFIRDNTARKDEYQQCQSSCDSTATCPDDCQFVGVHNMEHSQINGARPRYRNFAEFLIARCQREVPFEGQERLNNMCKALTESKVLQEALTKACNAFSGRVKKQIQNIADKISFKQQVQIGEQSVVFEGQLSYYPSTSGADEIEISATASAEAKLNKYVSADSLELTLRVDTDGKITVAKIKGTAHLHLGEEREMDSEHDDGSGTFEISFEDGTFSLESTLHTNQIQFSDAFALDEGTATLTLTNNTFSVGVSATAAVKYASDQQPILIPVEASYHSADHSFMLSGSSNATVTSVGGLKMLSVGDLSLSGKVRDGQLHTAAVGGTMCLGSNCESLAQGDNNLVSTLSLTYSQEQKAWLFLTHLKEVNLEKALASITERSFNMPDLLNTQLEQGIIALSSQDSAVDVNGFPKMSVKAGLTIAASAHITNDEETVFEACVPLAGSVVTIAEKPAKFKVAVHEKPTDHNFVGGSQILAFGALEGSGLNLVYSMKFEETLKLIAMAINKAGGSVPDDGLNGPVGEGVNAIAKRMDRLAMLYHIDENLIGSGDKHVALTGWSTTGGFGATILGGMEGGENTFVAAASMNSQFFGELLKDRLGDNPLASMPLFSNFDVAVMAATHDVTLPEGVNLPSPFDAQRTVEKGFCLVGKIGSPLHPCEETLCSLVSKAMSNNKTLAMSGCFGGAETSFKVGVESVKLSDAVTMAEAAIGFTLTPTSVEVAGTTTFNIMVKDNELSFGSKLSLTQAGPSTMLGIEGSLSGIVSNMFGMDKLSFYDMTLGASVGQVASVPTLTSAKIGGGACLGETDKCYAAAKGNAPSDGTIAGKLYLGIDASGKAYFYTELNSKFTLQDVASAIHQSLQLPDWAAQAGVFGYTEQSSPFMSFSTLPVTIDTLVPPLKIPAGFAMQGRLQMFNNQLGFKVAATTDGFKLALDAAQKISLADGKLLIAESKTSDAGPSFELTAGPTSFGGAINGYARIPGMGEGQIDMDLSSTSFSGKLAGVKVFGSELTFDLSFAMAAGISAQFEIEAVMDSPGGIGGDVAAILKEKAQKMSQRIQGLTSRLSHRHHGQGVCEDAKRKVSDHQRKCDDARHVADNARRRNAVRAWGAKKLECGSLSGAQAWKNTACAASHVFGKVKELMNKAIDHGESKVKQFFDQEITRVEFKASGVDSSVLLKIGLRKGEETSEINIDVDLSGANLVEVAKEIYRLGFQKDYDEVNAEIDEAEAEDAKLELLLQDTLIQISS
jgi:hypothetical protein